MTEADMSSAQPAWWPSAEQQHAILLCLSPLVGFLSTTLLINTAWGLRARRVQQPPTWRDGNNSHVEVASGVASAGPRAAPHNLCVTHKRLAMRDGGVPDPSASSTKAAAVDSHEAWDKYGADGRSKGRSSRKVSLTSVRGSSPTLVSSKECGVKHCLPPRRTSSHSSPSNGISDEQRASNDPLKLSTSRNDSRNPSLVGMGPRHNTLSAVAVDVPISEASSAATSARSRESSQLTRRHAGAGQRRVPDPHAVAPKGSTKAPGRQATAGDSRAASSCRPKEPTPVHGCNKGRSSREVSPTSVRGCSQARSSATVAGSEESSVRSILRLPRTSSHPEARDSVQAIYDHSQEHADSESQEPARFSRPGWSEGHVTPTRTSKSPQASAKDRFLRSPRSLPHANTWLQGGVRQIEELPLHTIFGPVHAPFDYSFKPRAAACPSWNIMLERHAAARAVANERRELSDMMESIAQWCHELALEEEAHGAGMIPREAEPVRRPAMQLSKEERAMLRKQPKLSSDDVPAPQQVLS